ncbi:hypothetical protein DSL64_19310 [Dyadobacter luteus]|uniref:DUF3649 domain-containing protein n=1 Tax=Dyadobacter luteus TaxID=2259619 RepID=A0A3D8Y7H9_9BACT|nr:hypothetical protein [Dyadobacter luteus]REA58821.1 hypothetical protein DSL64_19310 [Dyadobacter luteus]
MPAKKEYLTTKGQRALKITAGLIGGYFLAITFQMMIATMLPYQTAVILTGAFSVFIMWVALMVLAFLARNGWVIWGIYLAGIAICGFVIYLLK